MLWMFIIVIYRITVYLIRQMSRCNEELPTSTCFTQFHTSQAHLHFTLTDE